jgi:hypothetical protein
MGGARSRRLSGVYGVWLVALGCSGETSTSGNQLTGTAGAGIPRVAGAAGVAGGQGAAGSTQTAVPRVPTAGLGSAASAGTTAVGAAGTSAGVAGTARASGSAGAAGTGAAGGPSALAGTGAPSGTAGTGGAAGSAAGSGSTGTMGTTGAACPLPLPVDDGVPVNGAGCNQQWEGIVMTKGGRGLCTAAFISDRHLISASHCYASDGSVSLDVSAPTWDKGMDHTFQATVKRSGSNMSLDVSVIDLGKPVEWATPERRFVLHSGKVDSVELHTYGFGGGGGSGQAGTLRGVPDRATIKVSPDGNGNINGKAGEARLCSGDSGGPAFVENTAAVLYAINQAIVPTGVGGRGLGGTCAGEDWTIMFTAVSDYMDFVEMALGKPCTPKQVDGMDVAQCW